MNKSQPRVRASWLGSVPYREAWDLQAALVRELREGAGHDTLLLLEHPHVFTMGKAAAPEHVLWDEDERARRRVEVVWSDRGGEATYHGPGEPGFTGVWRNGDKLAAIGIKLDRSVVSHGFALNLTTDLGYFEGIVPCGHADRRPTSMEAVTGRRIDTRSAAEAYTGHFEAVFGVGVDWLPAGRLREAQGTPVRT